MGTTAQKLAYLQQTKAQLKSAIETQLGKYITYSTSPIDDDFRSFVTFINELPVGSNLSTGEHSGNNNITAVNIPSNFSEVSARAFRNCPNLTSITLAEGVKYLRNYCFQNTPITSIVIPKSVESIGNSAFYTCTSLETVTLQEGLKTIGSLTFQDCRNLSSITLPLSIEFIGNQSFNGCNSLSAVYYNGTLVDWCNISFDGRYDTNPTYHSHNLYINGEPITSIVIPSSVSEVKNSAFVGLTNIENVIVGENVTRLGENFLYDCTGFTTISLPEGLQTIGYNFCSYVTGNSTLTSLVIPSTVTGIGSNFLFHCYSMQSLTMLPITPPTLGGSSLGGSYPIYVPAESVNAYKSATDWSALASRIQAIPS